MKGNSSDKCCASKVGRQVNAIEGKTIDQLLRYEWLCHISELENIIERALIRSSAAIPSIGEDVLPVTTQAARRAPPARRPAEAIDLDSVQRGNILTVLRQTDWTVHGKPGAAVKLGVKPLTLRHRMKETRDLPSHRVRGLTAADDGRPPPTVSSRVIPFRATALNG
jgi:transcriptional regulator with GAF, ATPase, and Fis domain